MIHDVRLMVIDGLKERYGLIETWSGQHDLQNCEHTCFFHVNCMSDVCLKLGMVDYWAISELMASHVFVISDPGFPQNLYNIVGKFIDEMGNDVDGFSNG